jgi:hypothetical protein
MSEVCIANIGPRGIRLRRITGLVGFVLGAGLGLGMVLGHAPYAYRILALGPFLIGALGWLQAREKTCVSLASQHARDDDAETAPASLDAAAIDAAIARQAGSIRRRAFLLALALTAVLFALPPYPA